MRVAKFMLSLTTAAALAHGGRAEERIAPLDPIAGFELRLLDKKFPVQITADGKTEEHATPVWVFMPEAGRAQAPLGDITEPADLDGGTTLLPVPPDGFGLRALKLPIRESFILADGRQAIVELPVFVYFRRVETEAQPPNPTPVLSIPAVPGSENNSTAAITPANENKVELDRLRSELTEVHRQFSAIIPLMDDGTAKERLKTLVQQLGAITAAYTDRTGHNPDVSIDYNIKP